MANIKEQIEDITYAVKSMIDSGFFPDYIDLLKEQDHQGYNDFFIVFHICFPSAPHFFIKYKVITSYM